MGLEASQEAMLDHVTAIEWAEQYVRDHGVWPKRRWRVEGSRAGMSRLLTHRKAKETQAEYGGEIVKLLSSSREYRAMCVRTGRNDVYDCESGKCR